MAKKIIFVDQVSQYPNRFLVTDDGGGLKEVTPSPGTISIQGTPLSADNLNAIADEVIYKLKDTATIANTYVANVDGLLGYFDSLTVLFKPNNTNTDGSTLNLTSLGAIPIKKVDDTGTLVALSQNDLIKGKYYTMTYDSTDAQNPCFVMNNPSAELASIVTAVNSLEDRLNTDEEAINNIKTETVKFTILQGTANTYAATISTVSTLTSGLEINFVPNITNTGASTLNINELGAKNITYNGSAIASGMLVQNKLYKVLYNGVSFELQPSSNFTPVSNGQVQTNLNADMVDGKHASDFAPSGFGLGGKTTLINNVDANTVTNTGFYYGNNMVNVPGNSIGYLLVEGADSNFVKQTFTEYNTPNVYTRTNNAGTWGTWSKTQKENYAVTTNSGNAYSATIGGLSSLTDGLQVRVKFNSASSGATTLNINSLGAKNIVDYFGNAVTNIRQNLIANLAYEATSGNFMLQGKGGGGNAIASHVLSGETCTVDSGQITGSMANNLSLTNTISVGSNGTNKYFRIPYGAYLQDNGQGYPEIVASATQIDNNIASANIKAGVSICGVSGKSSVVDTADATALTADKILNGYSAYANGNKINGSATIESLGGKRFKSDTITLDSQGNISYICGFRPSIIIVKVSNGFDGFYLSSIGFNYTKGGFIIINESYPNSPSYYPIAITDSGFSAQINELGLQNISLLIYE